MVKLQEVKGQYTISIPKEKIIQACLKKGDVLAIDFDKRTGELILAKVKLDNNNI
jgi:bifunctional DNA-binding transcriptional regulator/antitoxin component of YhaV-PrlF toxin-antitoxin module